MNSLLCLWCVARAAAQLSCAAPAWHTVYDLDPSSGCPGEWQQYVVPSQERDVAGDVPVCGRGPDVFQASAILAEGWTYTKIRGAVLGYARGSPDSFRTEPARYESGIDDAYTDGVSFARWTTDLDLATGSQRRHVATYANGLSYAARGFGYYINGNCYGCHGGSDKPPAWLGEDYYCDSQLRAESSIEPSCANYSRPLLVGDSSCGVAQEGCNRRDDCLDCGPTTDPATSGTIFANEIWYSEHVASAVWGGDSGYLCRGSRYATSDDFPGRPFGSFLKELDDGYANDPIEARIMAGQTTSNEDSAVRRLTLEVFGCPSDPAPVCGDGAVTPPEQCDVGGGSGGDCSIACTAWSPEPCKSAGTCTSADVVPPRGEDLPGKEEVEQLPAWVRVADVVFDDHFRSLETATGDGAACSNNAPDAVMDACPGDLVRFDARGRAVCGPPLEHNTRTDPYSVFVAGPRGTPVAGFKGRVTAVALGAHDGFLNTSWLHTDVSGGNEMYPNDHAKSTGLEGRYVDGISLTVGGTDCTARAHVFTYAVGTADNITNSLLDTLTFTRGEAGVNETDAAQNPFYTNCFESAPMAKACFIGNCPCHGGDALRAASLDDAATAWAVPDFVGSDYLCDAGKGYDMGNAWQCEELFTDPATICDGNRTRDERWWLRRGARPGSFKKRLGGLTTEPLEVRLLSGKNSAFETVALASVELYACACPDQGPNADLERCYALCEGCEPGHAKNASTCVPCPAGTHNADGLGECAPCEPGSIAETSGSAECALCNVDGGQTSSAARTACECRAGSYDPGAGANCVDCPGGAACPQGSSLETITAKEGYYRFHAGAERFYECPAGDDACVGGAAGDAICKENAHGPLCKLCRGGTFRFTGSEGRAQCKSCADEVNFLWQEVVRSAGVVVVWGLLILGVLRLRSEIDRAWAWAAMVQLFYFLMTMSRFAAIHHVSFPLPLQQLVWIFDAVTLDLSAINSFVRCEIFHEANFYHYLLASTLAFPILLPVFLAVAAASVPWSRLRTERSNRRVEHNDDEEGRAHSYEDREASKSRREDARRGLLAERLGRAFQLWLFLVAMFHSSICSSVASLFDCVGPRDTTQDLTAPQGFRVREDRGSRFLAGDFSIRCDSDTYQAYAVYGGFCVAVYAFALPALFFLDLWRRRRQVAAGKSVDDGALKFLTRDLKAEYWWCEVAAMVFRSLVAGLARSVASSSLSLCLAVVVVVVHRTMVLQLKPYVSSAITLVVEALMRAALSIVLLALAVKGNILGKGERYAFASCVLCANLVVFVSAYRAFKSERWRRVVANLRGGRPVDGDEWAAVRVGVAKEVLDDVVVHCALDVLDAAFEGDLAAGDPRWAHLEDTLLALEEVWTAVRPADEILDVHLGPLLRRAETFEAAADAMDARAVERSLSIVAGPLAPHMDVPQLGGGSLAEAYARALQPLVGDLAAPPPPPRVPPALARSPSKMFRRNDSASRRAPRKSQSRATVQRFLDLALVAHDLNIRAQEKLKEGVRGVLAEVPGGAELKKLESFDSGECLQPALATPHLRAFADHLGKGVLDGAVDARICTEALHALAAETFEPFRAALRALVADRAGLRLRCEDATSIKRTARMRVKVEENAGQSWPRAREISDCLRATVVCDSAASLVGAYEALAATAGFRALRLKNKVALLQKPFCLHANFVFDGGLAPVVVEVQFTPALVDATVWASHRLYEISRAPTWQALRESQTAGDPALGAAAAAIIKSQLESPR